MTQPKETTAIDIKNHGIRVLHRSWEGRQTYKSESCWFGRDGTFFGLVDAGRTQHAEKGAAVLRFALDEVIDRIGKNIDEYARDITANKPVILSLLHQGIRDAYFHATEAAKHADYSIGKDLFIGIIFAIGEVAFCGHMGSGRLLFRKKGAFDASCLFDAEAIDNPNAVHVDQFYIRNGDLLVMCTDGFSKEAGEPSQIVPTAVTAIESSLHALSGHRFAEDATVAYIWLDFPWHAAAQAGFNFSSEAISRSSLFKNLSYRETCLVLTYATMERISAADFLVKEGDPGDSVYILTSGRVNASSKNGSVNRFLETPGDCIGEIAFLAPGPRTASVVALENAEFLKFDNNALRELFQSHPSIGVEILAAMGVLAVNRLRKIETGHAAGPIIIPAIRRRNSIKEHR